MLSEQELSTRSVLLTMLKTSGSLTIGQMAQRIGVTEMAVRRHMHVLERDGLVAASLVRQSVGRPTHMYALTDKAQEEFPSNYHALALDLLEELMQDMGEAAVSRLFERRKDRLAERYRQRMQSSRLEDKVQVLADIQNRSGYMATWSRGEDGDSYVLDEFNCPIAQVANRFQHACESELELFRKLLGVDVERVECLATSGRKCRYVIRDSGLESE